MPNYEIALVIRSDRPVEAKLFDEIFEVGLDDSTISSQEDQLFLDVEREGETLLGVLIELVQQVESVSGLSVIELKFNGFPGFQAQAWCKKHRISITRDAN